MDMFPWHVFQLTIHVVKDAIFTRNKRPQVRRPVGQTTSTIDRWRQCIRLSAHTPARAHARQPSTPFLLPPSHSSPSSPRLHRDCSSGGRAASAVHRCGDNTDSSKERRGFSVSTLACRMLDTMTPACLFAFCLGPAEKTGAACLREWSCLSVRVLRM